jgi:hypothetical protein
MLHPAWQEESGLKAMAQTMQAGTASVLQSMLCCQGLFTSANYTVICIYYFVTSSK